MLHFPWRNEQELLGKTRHTCLSFMSQTFKRQYNATEIFESNGDAINEALKILRNFDGVPTCSYDPINDQENEDLRQSLPDNSDETESFNESLPQHLAPNP